MNNSRRLLNISRLVHRHFSQSTIRRAEQEVVDQARIDKLREVQKRFGVEDDIPVFIKNGFSDRALLGITYLLISTGLGLGGHTIYVICNK